MKDRFKLILFIFLSWAILIIFQKYLPIQSAVYILFAFMFAYAVLIQISQFHQKRKRKKLIKKGLLKENESLQYKPFVSILIPAHNEEYVIKDTIENITSIDYENYEVIVIDDRSSDNTAKIINRLSENNSKVRSIVRGKSAFPGKSAVLNEAMLVTKGEVICVFDADARVKPDFIEKILPYLADKEVGAVQARKVINNSYLNFLTRSQDNEYALDTHFQAGRDSIKGAVELRGNGQLVKRQALVDIGGWNNFTLTDDLDMSTRLHLKGWDIRFAQDVEVYEEGVIDFYPLLRQRRRWVEGSIRRYLDYVIPVSFSRKISLRVSLDMLAYLAEFALPVWLVSEYIIQGIRFIKGIDNHIIYTLAFLPILGIFFTSGLIYSLKKYKNLSIWTATKEAIETGIYMIFVWVPVVLYIVLKIIFAKRDLDWGKTAHGVQSQTGTEKEVLAE